MVLHQQLRVFEAELRQLFVLHMWGEQSDLAQMFLRGYTKEAITRSAHRERLEAEPERWAPVAELAEELTARKVDWNDADIDNVRDGIVRRVLRVEGLEASSGAHM
jgi:hypothetical protein